MYQSFHVISHSILKISLDLAMATSSCSPTMQKYSTIKELVDLDCLDTITLPSVYISRNPALASEEIIIKEDIPTVDFSLLTCGNFEERSKTIREIGKACAEWGCFTVVNHGMSESCMAAMMEAFFGFFDLTEEEREGHTGKNLYEPVKWGTSFNNPVKEVRYWRDFMRVIVHPTFHSPNKPSNFRMISEEYSRNLREMSMELLRAICESLGLPESCMEESLQMKSCSQLLIGNLYPPCPQPELAMGLPPHSDPSLLTMLLQNGTDAGLQMMHHGRWVPVDPTPASFFVLVGDLLEMVSNGMYKSVMHRVLLNNITSTRMSVMTIISPPLETVIAPLPQLVDSESKPQEFRAIGHKEFIELQYHYQLHKSVMDQVRM